MAEGVRDINFGLRVNYDGPGSEAAFAALERRTQQAAEALRDRFKFTVKPDFVSPSGPAGPTETKSSGQSRKTDIDRELDHELRQKAKAAEAAEKARQREEAAATKAAAKLERELERSAQAAERAREREAKALEKVVIASERAAEKQAAAAQKAADKSAKEAERTAAKYQSELDKQEKAAEKTRAAEVRAVERAVIAEEAQRKKQTAAVEKAYQQHESAVARGKAAEAALLGAFNQTTEGALKLGRGFTMLGLVGEEDTKKIVQGLLKVQGAFDVVKGGLGVWQGLTSMVDKYRERLEAAEKAQKALAVAQALGKAAGIGRGAGPAASSASGPGGMIASVMGSFGSLGGIVGKLGPLLSALTGPVGIVLGGLTALGGLLFTSGGGFKKIQPGLDKISDAFERLWEKLKPIAEVVATALTDAFNLLAEGVAFVADNLMYFALGPLGIAAGLIFGFNDSAESATQAQERLAAAAEESAAQRKEMDDRLAKVIDAEAAASEKRFQARQEQVDFNEMVGSKALEAEDRRRTLGIQGKGPDFASSKVDQGFEDHRKKTIEELKAAEQALAEAQRTGLTSTTEALAARDAAAQRLIDLEKQHLRLTEDRGRRAIDDLAKQRDAQQKLFEDAKREAQDAADKLKDAQSKFADLDPFEQQRAKDAKAKLDRGEQLDAEEAKTLRDLGLDSLADKARDNRASEGDVEAGTLFDEEKKNVERLKGLAGDAGKVLAEIGGKIEVEVAKNEELTQQILDALKPLLEAKDKQVTQQIENAVRQLAQQAGEDERARSAGRRKP